MASIKTTLSTNELFMSLHSSEQGLSSKEASRRIKQYGQNILAHKKKFTTISLFLSSFISPITLLLLTASLISAFLGNIANSYIILFIVCFSGFLSFFQQFKANKAFEILQKKISLYATVLRDGIKKEISFLDVTLGDIIFLSVGNIVPANARILESRNLTVDQSTLTGESFPVEKTAEEIKYSADNPFDQRNILFAGTNILTGETRAVIVAIGKATQMGQLADHIMQRKPQTSFEKGIRSFSFLLIRIIVILTLVVLGANILLHRGFFSSLLFAVAVAVGITPDLMPVVVTVALTQGALKMKSKNVIVKFLPSIENLGSMTILCADKTGTLTENEPILKTYEDAQGTVDKDVLLYGLLTSYFQTSFTNPLDTALLMHSHKFFLHEYEKIEEIPYDFERKQLSVVIKKENQFFLVTKGSPFEILKECQQYQQSTSKKPNKLTNKKRKELEERVKEYSLHGYRVIAVAKKEVVQKDRYTTGEENKLTFLGFLLFSSPLKPGISHVLSKLRESGIAIKILTGDNEQVTKKICQDAGIPVKQVLTGEEISKLSDHTLLQEVQQTTVFARLTPEQKARIIVALKDGNEVVGFLGDGINDAPPLRAADVGIAVENGSDIAKHVADIILTHKSLSVLLDGILEGRKTFGNIFKYIKMELSFNFGNMLSIAIASLILPFFPILPVQIILIDFLYDLSQITISSDNVDPEVTRSPQQWDFTFLKKFMLTFGPLALLFYTLTFCILFSFFHSSITLFQTGWFVASFTLQTLVLLSIRTKTVPFFKRLPNKKVLLSIAVTLAIGWIIVYSPFAFFFHFTNLPFIFYLLLILEVIGYVGFVEIVKIWFYRRIYSEKSNI